MTVYNVLSGVTSSGLVLTSGDRLFVYSGGIALSNTVSSGAQDWINDALIKPFTDITVKALGAAGDGAAWEALVARMAVDGAPEWAAYYAARTKLYLGSTPPCAAGPCKDAILSIVNGTDSATDTVADGRRAGRGGRLLSI